jgi:selenoprotein W-related protein
LRLRRHSVPGKGGIFEIRVGDEVVVARSQGHFPDAAEIVEAVAAAMKAG